MSRPHQKGTTTRRRSRGQPPRHQGVIRKERIGYVLGDLCKVCGEPLYTSKDDPTRKWCTDPACSSHRR